MRTKVFALGLAAVLTIGCTDQTPTSTTDSAPDGRAEATAGPKGPAQGPVWNVTAEQLGMEVVRNSFSVPQQTQPGTTHRSAAFCPTGKVAISGGFEQEGLLTVFVNAPIQDLVDKPPVGDREGWLVGVVGSTQFSATVYIFAVCINGEKG